METGKEESSHPASFPRDLPRETRERIEGLRLEGVERRGSGSPSGSEIRDETEPKTKKLAARELLKWAALVAKAKVHGPWGGEERAWTATDEGIGGGAVHKEDVAQWLSDRYYRMRISHRVR